MNPQWQSARTRHLGANGQPQIEVTWNDSSIPDEDAYALVGQLEHDMAAGKTFQHDQLIKVGWITTRIQQKAPDLLELYEPDFRSTPIKWILGVNRCLRDLRRQTDVVLSLAPELEPCFPDVGQAALVCDRYAGGKALIIERGKPEQRFSGWYITCDEEGEEETHHRVDRLLHTSLYDIALKIPALVQFLAIPPGCAGRIAKGEIELYTQDGPLTIRRGSYLERWVEENASH